MTTRNCFSAPLARCLKLTISASASELSRRMQSGIVSAGSRPLPRLSESKKLLLILLAIVVTGLCGGMNSRADTIPLSAFTGPCSPLPLPSSSNFKSRLDAFVMANCYGVQKQNWPHEAARRSSEGLHSPFVKLWYSPQLYRWMTKSFGPRQGQIPDGSVVIKEEYDDDDASSPICFWSVMTRDSNLWWDGWNWAVVGVEGACGATPPPTPPPSNGCPEPQFSFNGPTAINCIGCHASAISGSSTNAGNPGTGTYSTPEFVTPATEGNVNATLPLFFPPLQTEAALLALTGNGSLFPPPAGACMVPVTQDLAASKPYTSNPRTTGPSLFVTSNQCASCHDATDNTPLPTHMLFPDAQVPGPVDPTSINLSTYGEWRYSMMGLSGRDPIFFAQLDTESTVHSNLQGKGIFSAPYIQDTCLSCHGVMGQRQYHLDKGNGPLTFFTRNQLNDPNSKYAALARDGVSCMVCHQMIDQKLDDPSTYTGKFLLGPPGQVFGPYPSGNSLVKVGHNVIPAPMINSVGILPVFGSQVGESKLCASCHTIVLPVYNAKGKLVNTDFEQTTYLEWLNSSFANANYESCQNCHMPDTFYGKKLAYQIANIEDSTFPVVPETGTQTSLPLDQLILETRYEYGRHLLNGSNAFALDMFDQFRTVLGLYATDGLLPDPLRETYNGQKNAVGGTVALAQSSAQVSFDSVMNTGTQLQADVRVQNEVGHKFPSGVSFRRAFLDFQVLDGSNPPKVLWESGATNAKGVIIDSRGNPLVTEFFTPGQTSQPYQPHFWTGNPITSDEQVQIYEELVQDPQGQFTTSFLSLNNKVKDNRILPQGWSLSGPMGNITQPEGTGSDPNYQGPQPACGCSVVRYQVPLTSIPGAVSVQATLYYQSIPPYYLSQRSHDANGPDTQRLIMFTNQLNVGTSYPEIADWKLKIASGTASIP
jgi:hypothetical protein